MSKYSIKSFVESSRQKDQNQGEFELEGEKFLELNIEGKVWMKAGSMIAYRGDVKFTREGMLEHGLGSFLKKQLTGETVPLMKAEGTGSVYIADHGKKIIPLMLEDESIFVNSNDLLAFDETITHSVTMMRRMAGMLAGGLFNMKLSGKGMIAITAHGQPLTLEVKPGSPVFTDPNSTVAWSGNLTPDIKTDISFKTFLGRGSGESIQMKFEGEGFVIVQPFEEVYFQAS